jgi:tetratricopeptide (TPR) repeat protein
MKRSASVYWLTAAMAGFLLLTACGGRRTPETPDQQIAFGVEMARQGLWSEALFRFEQVERTDPANPRNLNNLAVACEALGQFDRALEYYQSAIRADPANKELKRNYSRFVEFYRAFKPDEQAGGEDDDSA